MSAIRAFVVATCALLVLAPAAQAVETAFEPGTCNLAFRSIGPVSVQRSELRKPVERTSRRAEWRLDDTWSSTVPQLNQVLHTRKLGTIVGASHAKQQSLSIDAETPDHYGWRYEDDEDDATPPCAIVGQTDWQAPRVLVRQERAAVRLLAVSQHSIGDRTGCRLQDYDDGVPCPQLTTTVIRLKAPIGQRRLVLETLRD